MKRFICFLSRPSFSPQESTTSIKTLVSHGLYSQALKASTALLDFHLTDQIYSLFIKSGFSIDIFLGSSLIDRFSKSGDLRRAHRLLLDMPDTDTVVWNALISGYARIQQTEPVFDLFNSLRCSGLKPDIFTLSSLIKACNNSKENGMAHAISLKMGFSSGVFVISGLLDNYSKSGDLCSAEKCFAECLVMDTVVWTAMMSGYIWNAELGNAREIFMEMRVLGLDLNKFSLTSVLGALSDIKEGEQIHGFSIKMGFLFSGSTHLSNAVMSIYCRCGSKLDGVKLFDEISEPDVVSWTARIGAAYDGEEALELFRLLCSRDMEMNEYTIVNVLSAIGTQRLLETGKQIQARCYKAGYLPGIFISNALISMYGKYGQLEDAKVVFDEMLSRDSVSWNSLITGYAENGLVGQALGVFSQIQNSSLEPTKFTLASVLEVLSYSDAPQQVMQIHSQIIKLGFATDDSMVTGLITAYGKCNGINESKRVFTEIDNIDLVHLNAMAATFTHAACHTDTLKLFRNTQKSDLEVDSITFSIALKACGALTDLEQGRSIHSLALKSGVDQCDFVGSAVVDVYCKCGSIADAEKAFRKVAKDNLAIWNAMIMGYAQHGHYQEVFKLLKKMCELGIDPDEITYLGILYSCSHAGLIKEAYTHLNSMFECHGVMPCLEHYACMVDLLGRAGHLEEAKRIIDKMPITPDAKIWQILLSACSIQGNVKLGRLAAQELLELQPENDSAYVLLSNLYASVNMWEDVGRMRRVMKEKRVSKEPGCSWIQVKGTVHSFFVDDTSHHDSIEIYMKLQELNKQMITAPEFEGDGVLF
ncbi:hypothetical protein HHK36_029007 [Tetracentron sinense]|uniref:Pentatricopeptide repeat-containing protein n=1 Tax=Tetracentron sinense TaxID=13715 RepID=A0A835D0S0_TETSI|nr:hypothetical protein HHK36_029007 [Tetracentron sinense]